MTDWDYRSFITYTMYTLGGAAAGIYLGYELGDSFAESLNSNEYSGLVATVLDVTGVIGKTFCIAAVGVFGGKAGSAFYDISDKGYIPLRRLMHIIKDAAVGTCKLLKDPNLKTNEAYKYIKRNKNK